MDRFGSFWGRSCGSLWIVLDRFGSFWVVPRFSNYDQNARVHCSYCRRYMKKVNFWLKVLY